MKHPPKRPKIEILKQTANWFLLNCVVPADLLFFNGHFKGHPVLPGVVQIDWAIAFAEELLGVQNTFSEMRQLKFQNLILPDAAIKLSLSFDEEKNILVFRYFINDNTLSSGRIVYHPLPKEAK